jgi:hypothetical protein
LAGTGATVGDTLVEEALVGVALDVDVEDGPGLLVDKVLDELGPAGRVLDLVLGLAGDLPKQAGLGA